MYLGIITAQLYSTQIFIIVFCTKTQECFSVGETFPQYTWHPHSNIGMCRPTTAKGVRGMVVTALTLTLHRNQQLRGARANVQAKVGETSHTHTHTHTHTLHLSTIFLQYDLYGILAC